MEKVVRANVRAVFGLGVALFALATVAGFSANPVVAQQPTRGVFSKFKVILPWDETDLRIDKKQVKTSGRLLEFETSELVPGATYTFEFAVRWQPNNYTILIRQKTVDFQAGEDVVVDLTKDEGQNKALILFVPTPAEVVDQMIKLARVRPGDVVFEPGCGDGRVLIAAVKAGATRAVGIDLDPDRVKEANEAVANAGLGDRIEIRKGDALAVKDYGDASVVFLYMGEEFDLLIRPTLMRELKVGTRIVSHYFLMGAWKPDRTVMYKTKDGEVWPLHLWTVTEEAKRTYGTVTQRDRALIDKPINERWGANSGVNNGTGSDTDMFCPLPMQRRNTWFNNMRMFRGR